MTIFERHAMMVLVVMSGLFFLLMATTFNSLGQVLPFMVKDLGMSWTAAGLGFTLLGTACGAASMLPAAALRRLGVGVTLWIGTMLLIAGFTALAFARGAGLYELGTLLLGFGFCFCGAIPAVHLISLAFDKKRSAALGFYFTMGNLGAVFGPLFFLGVNALTSNWRIYWLIAAGASLVLGGGAATLGRTGERTLLDAARAGEGASGGDSGWTLRAAVTTWQFWLVTLSYTGCLLVNTSVHSFAFQHYLELGVSKTAATGLISASAVVSAAASSLAGFAGQRVPARWLMVLAVAMSAICAACLSGGASTAEMIGFALTFGLGMGMSTVASTLMLRDYFGGKAALELYSLMTLLSTSAAIGPSIGGRIHDTVGSFDPLFHGFVEVLAVICLAVLVTRAPKKR